MSAAPYIAVEGLSVSLGRRRVLSDVSCALSLGELVALVGPNGAGKTTLLRAIAGLIPVSGSIRAGGDEVAGLSVRERAKRFAYLPQDHAVHWPLSVRDVVALGRYPHGAADPSRLGRRDADAVNRAIRIADLEAFADRRVTELSGGERARVALARVLAVEAPVILADEPIASLDPRYQIEVMEILRNAARAGALVVVVTHDLGFAARYADQALVLNHGSLVCQAPPEAAFEASVLAEVFRVTAYRAGHDGQAVLAPWAAL
jgi:iron complex transport system ATP-binding protein